MSPSPATETLIRERTERLARVTPRIQRCHVVVEQPHRHQQTARFSVRLDITTPRDEVVVTREPTGEGPPQALQALIRDAFDAATRRLEDHAARRRAI
jgi:Sigma 54 modulation protein / S30EA ribosomal protein